VGRLTQNQDPKGLIEICEGSWQDTDVEGKVFLRIYDLFQTEGGWFYGKVLSCRPPRLDNLDLQEMFFHSKKIASTENENR
jgi:hypothetical protein